MVVTAGDAPSSGDTSRFKALLASIARWASGETGGAKGVPNYTPRPGNPVPTAAVVGTKPQDNNQKPAPAAPPKPQGPTYEQRLQAQQKALRNERAELGAAPPDAGKTIWQQQEANIAGYQKSKEEAERPLNLTTTGQKELAKHNYRRSKAELERIRRTDPSAVEHVQGTSLSATPLTWEAYEALSVEQRAAVDFNTALIKAREADLTSSLAVTEEEKKSYQKDVDEIFGIDAGSVTFAPRTVALLKQLNLRAVGQDLDDFLSLDRAIDASEFKDFKFTSEQIKSMKSFDADNEYKPKTGMPENIVGSGYVNTAGIEQEIAEAPKTSGTGTGTENGVRGWSMGSGAGLELVEPKAKDSENPPVQDFAYEQVRDAINTRNIEAALAKSALTKYRERRQAGEGPNWNLAANLTTPGGIDSLDDTQIPFGGGRKDEYKATLDQFASQIYGNLANPEGKGVDELLAEFANPERKWSKEEQESVWDYLDRMTREDAKYGRAGGRDQKNANGKPLRSANDIRKLLGWSIVTEDA